MHDLYYNKEYTEAIRALNKAQQEMATLNNIIYNANKTIMRLERQCGLLPCSRCGGVPVMTRESGLKEGSHLSGWIARCCHERRISPQDNVTRSEAIRLFNLPNRNIRI